MTPAMISPMRLSILALLLALLALAFSYAAYRNSAANIAAENAPTAGPIFSVATSTGETYFIVNGNGRVGVGTLDPATALDVYGMIRTYSATSTACTEALAGAIEYDAWATHFFGCDGRRWRKLDN